MTNSHRSHWSMPLMDCALYYHTHTHTTILWLYGFCPGQPRWAVTRRNIYPLTPILVINCPLSASSIYFIHDILPVQSMCLTVFFHIIFPSFLWPTSWPGTVHFILHTFLHPIIVFFFATHAHAIATCFAVVPRLCHLILVSLSTLYLEFCLVVSCHTFI